MLDEEILIEIKQALFTSLSEKPAKGRASNALNIDILARICLILYNRLMDNKDPL